MCVCVLVQMFSDTQPECYEEQKNFRLLLYRQVLEMKQTNRQVPITFCQKIKIGKEQLESLIVKRINYHSVSFCMQKLKRIKMYASFVRGILHQNVKIFEKTEENHFFYFLFYFYKNPKGIVHKTKILVFLYFEVMLKNASKNSFIFLISLQLLHSQKIIFNTQIAPPIAQFHFTLYLKFIFLSFLSCN